MLDEGHHLGLEALGVHVLHRGHAQGHADVTLPLQQRVRPPVPVTRVQSNVYPSLLHFRMHWTFCYIQNTNIGDLTDVHSM